MSNSPKRNLSTLLQILAWALFGMILLLYLPLTWQVVLPLQFWLKQLTIFCLLVFIYYFNALVLVPQLLLKNRTAFFIITAVIVSLLFMVALQLSENWLHLPGLMEKVLKRHDSHRPEGPGKPLDMFALMISLLVLGISTSVTSIQKWQKDNQLRILLEQEKASSELAYLKSQINPHFFFNTLNNIYALMHIDIEASKKALHKLSRMMRYLLYETQHEHTLLSKEIAFVADFIELMKLRLPANAVLIFNEVKLKEDFTVSPMLFLPFIENAFKHGIDPAEKSLIEIKITTRQSTVELTVNNSFFDMVTSDKSIEDSGIGLVNTKRRLDLLYPGRHKLMISKDNNARIYKVWLSIDLV